MLNAAAKRSLRQDAHRLKPVVMVGQNGVTAAVLAEIDVALTAHELIKVRFRGVERAARAATVAEVARELDAEVVNVIGAIAVLYRKKPEQPRSNT